MFSELDHVAIVVRNTAEALKFYRDTLGLPVVLSEELPSVGVRLTHLDLGNTHLQLVEPLQPDHPLSRYLDEYGEGLHHLCMRVADVEKTVTALPARGLRRRGERNHAGPCGRVAAFLDPETTRGVLWEITSEPPRDDSV